MRETARSGPLLPTHLVAPLAWCAGACLLLAALLAAYTRGRRSTPVDLWVDRVLRPFGAATERQLDAVVQVVEPSRMVTACFVVGLAAVVGRHWGAAFLSGAGPMVALGATYVGKELVGRQSATLTDQFDAYPSGHTAGVFTLTALVFVLTLRDGALRHQLSRRAAVGLRCGTAALAAAAALALTALRHHYVTDVVGGAALTVGAVLAVAVVQQLIADRWRPRLRAPAPAGRARPPSCSPVPQPDPR